MKKCEVNGGKIKLREIWGTYVMWYDVDMVQCVDDEMALQFYTA